MEIFRCVLDYGTEYQDVEEVYFLEFGNKSISYRFHCN